MCFFSLSFRFKVINSSILVLMMRKAHANVVFINTGREVFFYSLINLLSFVFVLLTQWCFCFFSSCLNELYYYFNQENCFKIMKMFHVLSALLASVFHSVFLCVLLMHNFCFWIQCFYIRFLFVLFFFSSCCCCFFFSMIAIDLIIWQ